MNSISIGFSSPKKWKPFAEAIKLVDGTPYDHAFVKIKSFTLDRDLIYQASGTKVNFIGLTMFNENNIIHEEFEFEISDDTKTKLLQFCVDNVGKRYSLKSVWALFLYRKFGIKIKWLYDSEGFVCSVLAAIILEEVLGYEIGDPRLMTPRILCETIRKLKGNGKT